MYRDPPQTLIGCQSEWPKDKPFLLMHSRHARNLYNPKIKIFFEIAWTLFEIILFIHFIHLNKHLDRARGTLWINFIIVYSLPLQMKSFGPQKSMGKKVPFWHFFIKASFIGCLCSGGANVPRRLVGLRPVILIVVNVFKDFLKFGFFIPHFVFVCILS